MKYSAILLFGALASFGAQPEEPKAPPSYVSEAPLPDGWPLPGPYDQVTEKSYPAYRAAFTTQKGQNLAFLRLFRHIQKNDIPMTAPVEMAMDGKDGGLEMSTMGFLYQSGKVGTAGPADGALEVRDVPAEKVLSYTWQGEDSKANIGKARESLDAALAARKITAGSFRLLGYNGPGTPLLKRTWELQALLK